MGKEDYVVLNTARDTYQVHCRQMNQSAPSHRICVSRSTLGQEHYMSELIMPPVMNRLETLHNHLPEVHVHLGIPLLPATSIFFNCWSSSLQ
jgi:hypothetical protein